MPVIYPKLYVKCQDEQDWSVFDNVTALISGATWWEYEGTYRDLPKVTFGTANNSPGNMLATNVPVAGLNKAVDSSSTTILTNLRTIGSDDALNIPPRNKLVQHTGYMLTTSEDGELVFPPPIASFYTFTISSPGVLFFGDNLFVSGELVALSSDGTLPAGLSATAIYQLIKLGSTSARLRDTATGLMATTSSSGTGTHTATKLTDLVYQPAQTFRFSDTRRPQFSLSTPE